MSPLLLLQVSESLAFLLNWTLVPFHGSRTRPPAKMAVFAFDARPPVLRSSSLLFKSSLSHAHAYTYARMQHNSVCGLEGWIDEPGRLPPSSQAHFAHLHGIQLTGHFILCPQYMALPDSPAAFPGSQSLRSPSARDKSAGFVGGQPDAVTPNGHYAQIRLTTPTHAFFLYCCPLEITVIRC